MDMCSEINIPANDDGHEDELDSSTELRKQIFFVFKQIFREVLRRRTTITSKWNRSQSFRRSTTMPIHTLSMFEFGFVSKKDIERINKPHRVPKLKLDNFATVDPPIIMLMSIEYFVRYFYNEFFEKVNFYTIIFFIWFLRSETDPKLLFFCIIYTHQSRHILSNKHKNLYLYLIITYFALNFYGNNSLIIRKNTCNHILL